MNSRVGNEPPAKFSQSQRRPSSVVDIKLGRRWNDHKGQVVHECEIFAKVRLELVEES